MKKIFWVLIAVVLFSSHDMYLKLDTYFLNPNIYARIKLYNGTFEKSDNIIARDRIIDASLVGNGQRVAVDTTQWSEREDITFLNFRTGDAGTWMAGVSTRARNIEMEAEAFNDYLAHDGVLDMLEWRKKNDALDQDAVEKYSKHVKTIFQVGDEKSDDWQTVLGYPIEFVPLKNPYELESGDELPVQLLWQGEPLANQLVYVGGAEDHSHDHDHDEGHSHDHDDDEGHDHDHDEAHSHDHDDEEGHDHDHDEAHSHDHDDEEGHDHDHDDDDHNHNTTQQFRTDASGKLNIPLKNDGIWYLRTIHLELSEEEGLTHESNWATLTFEVTHTHGDDLPHDHDHEEGLGIPSYTYWIGSAVLIFGLFLWFNRKGE
ncbi:MAG: DUF4198 domain-containing protein [Bacteroidota bacterium]